MMKHWFWMLRWTLRNPRKFLCDMMILECHKNDCGNRDHYRARRLVRNGYYKRPDWSQAELDRMLGRA